MGADTPGTWLLGTRSTPFPWDAPPSHAGSPNLLNPPPTYSNNPGMVAMMAICPATDPGCGMFSLDTCSQNFFTGSG